MGELIGYARVSSRTQSLDIQTDALTGANCTKIFAEKFTGTRTTGRVELERLLEYVREGDIVCIAKLDRLARSLPDLLKITAKLESKGVELRCLDQAIDTTTPEGRMTYQILGAVAEFETSIRKARQREGIDAALAKGLTARSKAVLQLSSAKTLKRQLKNMEARPRRLVRLASAVTVFIAC